MVLGLATSKGGKLGKKETLVQRIKEASKYVPLEQLSLCPQCGFVSTEEDQWKKLALIVDVGKEVWGISKSFR